MKRSIRFSLLLLFLPLQIFCQYEPLKKSDIANITYLFFQQHVENKELNEKIVKRWFKLYVDYLDGSKIYFLESEINGFLQQDSKTAKASVKKISKGDYSDFEKINALFHKAVQRSQKLRENNINSLFSKTQYVHNKLNFDRYAKNEKELNLRQNQYYEAEGL